MVKKVVDPVKSRRSKNNRKKGHDLERLIANDFKGMGYPEARRQLEYHADDAKGCDVQGVLPYLPQCKNTKKYVPMSTIKEVQCDRYLGDVPILIAKEAKGPTLATMHWDDLKRILKRLKKYDDESKK